MRGKGRKERKKERRKREERKKEREKEKERKREREERGRKSPAKKGQLQLDCKEREGGKIRFFFPNQNTKFFQGQTKQLQI